MLIVSVFTGSPTDRECMISSNGGMLTFLAFTRAQKPSARLRSGATIWTILRVKLTMLYDYLVLLSSKDLIKEYVLVDLPR